MAVFIAADGTDVFGGLSNGCLSFLPRRPPDCRLGPDLRLGPESPLFHTMTPGVAVWSKALPGVANLTQPIRQKGSQFLQYLSRPY